MKLEYAKNVRYGMFVRRRGKKYIKCPKNREPHGVVFDERRITMMTEAGISLHIIPRGIQIQGPCTAPVAKEK